MSKRRLITSNAVGLFLSVACVAHCMLMPVLLANLSSWDLGWLTAPAFHQVMAFLGVGIGIWSLVPGWKQHGRSHVLITAFVGLMIMNYAAFQSEDCCSQKCCASSGQQQQKPQPGVSTASPLATLQQAWSILWQHPTAVGATLLACAHLLNGGCTRACCKTQEEF